MTLTCRILLNRVERIIIDCPKHLFGYTFGYKCLGIHPDKKIKGDEHGDGLSERLSLKHLRCLSSFSSGDVRRLTYLE